VKDRVKEIMAIIFDKDVNSITDDASPDNIDLWDSLHHMNLIVSLEEEFEVQFTDDELIEMMNLPLILEVLKEKGIE
jgi:acyl carrier protein